MTPTPQADWNSQDPCPLDVVWWTRLDDRYQVEVQEGENAYCGTLLVFDHQDGDKLVHAEPVAVSYGAKWGPDVDDVNQWAARVLTVVDDPTQRALPMEEPDAE